MAHHHHHHAHAHAHHAIAHEAGFSLLRLSAFERLVGAGVFLAFLWGAVLWVVAS